MLTCSNSRYVLVLDIITCHLVTHAFKHLKRARTTKLDNNSEATAASVDSVSLSKHKVDFLSATDVVHFMLHTL
eukprot:3409901-Amphidinium_carterae.2